MIGEILGNRYEILEQIGEGGMSIVYKAMDNKLSRNVAVKVLKSEFSDNEDIVSKFKREATAIATLSDNNIVNVLDVGTQDEVNYIVMEYVKGKTLKDVINEFGKLNYETTIRIGTQIAKALDCAHKNNIIHRDVKPQNVLVTEEGLIKVTDFGIAKSASSATLTNTTTIMGSAQYLSPEQARGSFVDTRTDIYSLGIVLYEMITGKLPFEADSPVTIALKHIQEEVVPPKQLNSRVPDSLNKLILKTMEKDANKRYQTVKELISDLTKIKEDPNAIIGKVDGGNDGHTMVMSAVNPDFEELPENKDVDEDDYDEDYYDEDEDYYDDEDEYDESSKKDKNPKSKKKKMIIIAAISIVALLLLIAGVGSLMYSNGGESSSTSSENVTVPSIKGMTLDQAKDALTKVGLTLEEGGTEKSSEPENTVLDVYPDEGSTVKKGDKIRVMLSAGETKIKMPDLTENSLDDAKKILEKNQLTNYEVKNKSDNSVPKGEVISTDPAADTDVTTDTKITMYVSTGPDVKKVSVPKLVGLGKEAAISALQKAGFEANVDYDDVTDKSKDGKVISASNQPGEQLTQGEVVTITVGKYKEPEQQQTPPATTPTPTQPTTNKVNYSIDLQGVKKSNIDQALSSIAKENKITISYTIKTSNAQDNWVVDSVTPSSGTVDENSKVSVVITLKDPNAK